MEVQMADHLGMCFGVRDAIGLALRLTQQGPLTILGSIQNGMNPADIQLLVIKSILDFFASMAFAACPGTHETA